MKNELFDFNTLINTDINIIYDGGISSYFNSNLYVDGDIFIKICGYNDVPKSKTFIVNSQKLNNSLRIKGDVTICLINTDKFYCPCCIQCNNMTIDEGANFICTNLKFSGTYSNPTIYTWTKTFKTHDEVIKHMENPNILKRYGFTILEKNIGKNCGAYLSVDTHNCFFTLVSYIYNPKTCEIKFLKHSEGISKNIIPIEWIDEYNLHDYIK